MQQIKVNKGLFMSVQLKGEKGKIIGYKAKKHVNYIDFKNIPLAPLFRFCIKLMETNWFRHTKIQNFDPNRINSRGR